MVNNNNNEDQEPSLAEEVGDQGIGDGLDENDPRRTAGGTLNAPPLIPAAPTGMQINAAGGGTAGGGSGPPRSPLSSGSSTTTTISTRTPPPIPSYTNLGAGAGAAINSAPINTAPPIDPRAQAKYSKLFVRVVPLSGADLDEIEVLVTKYERKASGLKQMLYFQQLATESIEHKLGVAFHFIADKDDAEDGDQVGHLRIQQAYVENSSKIDALKLRMRLYDMLDVMRVPVGIRNRLATNIADMFEFEDIHILAGWDTVSWETACLWQWAVNTAMSDEDLQSSKWAKMLLFESCTTELRELVMSEYSALDVCFRGGVTFAWILCKKLFGLNRDTTAALIDFLKLFRNKGLRRYRGENVVLAKKELLVVCNRLAEAKELPLETPIDIITGLTLCSVTDFKNLFEHMLQEEKMKALNGTKRNDQQSVMAEIRIILVKATEVYDSMNTSDLWNVPRNQRAHVFGTTGDGKKREPTCWNCGAVGHTLDKCGQPRNDDKISENRRKYQEGKKSKSGNKGGGGATYEREKWGPPRDKEAGVRKIDGKTYAYCGKKCNGEVCGWNRSHSTRYHGQWSSAPSTFNLADVCPTHELVRATGAKPSSSSSSSSSRSSPSSMSSSTANASITSEQAAKLRALRDSARTQDAEDVMDRVNQILCLN